MRQTTLLALGCLLAQSALAAAGLPAAEKLDPKGVEFFEKKIRPILTEHCYKCHSVGADKAKAGLLLDSRDATRRGGENGPAVVPGSLDDSLIISALKHESVEMPPGKKLPAEVIANFEAWIKMGAPDPRDSGGVLALKREINIEEGRKFWAYQPVARPAPPALKSAWPRGAIDRFVAREWESRGLTPVRDATPEELIRRATFDLTGLPPTPAEIDAFVADCRQTAKQNPQAPGAAEGVPTAAFERLLDKLLASPRFGERWGRHWLDVARYAESNGNVDNTPFPHAWRYRNYVIDAFNADKPYNEFITEQLAGDLLPFASPVERNEHLIATGFLAITSKPRAQNNPNFQMDIVADQIEVATTAMLGLTVACARCHDHKFDPIPTAEYYALAGIFASTTPLYGDGGGNPANQKAAGAKGFMALVSEDPAAAREVQAHEAAVARLVERQRDLNDRLAKLGATPDGKGDGKGDGKKNNKNDADDVQKQIRRLQNQITKLQGKNGKQEELAQLRKALARLQAQGGVPERRVAESNTAAVQAGPLREELKKVQEELTALRAKAPPPAGVAMGVREGPVADVAICVKGESTDRGDLVERGFISVATLGAPPTISRGGSGRLELAEWMTSPRQPLTTRVIVNRLWSKLFGRGIVPSVDNFGELGERPTHPELLDHLASKFVADGWSIKQALKNMMLSRTYGLSSDHHVGNHEREPDNVFLWRMPPKRLDAESFRDAILAFSGKLDFHRPAAARIEQQNKKSDPVADTRGLYRGVYLPIIRNNVPEALGLFDFADPSIVVGAREETTVPAQSLYLMNSGFVIEQGRFAAQRLLAEGGLNDAARVELAHRLAFGRSPTAEQSARALDFLKKMDEAIAARERDAEARRRAVWGYYCQTLIASAEFRYLH